MKSAFLIIILLLFSNKPSSAQDSRPKIFGGWFSLEYFEILTETKSPLKAEKLVKNRMFYLAFWEAPNNNVIMEFTDNLHEGTNVDTFQFYSKNHKTVLKKKNDRWEVSTNGIKNDTLTLVDISKKKKIRFFKPSFQNDSELRSPVVDLMNSIVISGTYVNSQGEKFIFKNDGTAIWPNETFEYGLETDFEFSSTDYFYNVNKRNENGGHPAFAFEWKNEELHIFKKLETEYDGGQPITIVEAEPLYILKKIAE